MFPIQFNPRVKNIYSRKKGAGGGNTDDSLEHVSLTFLHHEQSSDYQGNREDKMDNESTNRHAEKQHTFISRSALSP